MALMDRTHRAESGIAFTRSGRIQSRISRRKVPWSPSRMQLGMLWISLAAQLPQRLVALARWQPPSLTWTGLPRMLRQLRTARLSLEERRAPPWPCSTASSRSSTTLCKISARRVRLELSRMQLWMQWTSWAARPPGGQSVCLRRWDLCLTCGLHRRNSKQLYLLPPLPLLRRLLPLPLLPLPALPALPPKEAMQPSQSL
mmetsp:Transcript_32308/g.57926  ORF Transcript_32308/g.57926 Transcript_32308/m.57926 type:complete len:200 (-) Transcript_32308:86-685(-)